MDNNKTFNIILKKYASNEKSGSEYNTKKDLLNLISLVEERYIFTIYGLFRNIKGYFPYKEYSIDERNKKFGLLEK